MRRSAYAIILSIPLAMMIEGCTPGSGYQVRMEALRATRPLDDPVPLSLWLYPGVEQSELAKIFVSGRITGAGWIELEGSFVEIPASAVTETGEFALRAELNPNRLATPSDAIFRAVVPLPGIVDLGGESESLVIRAESQAPFELRLAFRRTGSR